MNVAKDQRFLIKLEGFIYGPYTTETVQLYITSGQINKDCLAQEEGKSDWCLLREYSEFENACPALPSQSIPTPVAITTRTLRKQQEMLNRRQAEKPIYPSQKDKLRSKTLAAVLSVLIVGLGQFYNGDWMKGAFMLALTVLLVWSITAFLWIPMAIWSTFDAYRVARDPSSKW